MYSARKMFCVLSTSLVLAGTAYGEPPRTPYEPMMSGDSPATNQGWTVDAIFTISESKTNYMPPGIPDGLGAVPLRKNIVQVLVNHELNADVGYPYMLANGTELTGARVSYFNINTANRKVVKAGLAYDTVYDRAGNVVTDASQISADTGGTGNDGFARFCSSRSVQAGEYGFVDDIYFTGEETSDGKGGTEWALDIRGREIWAVPAMGYGAWENVSPVESGSDDTVALLLGDDVGGAPLYLYVGQKNAIGDGSFLDRNGLAVGTLYAWKSDDNYLTPADFNGFGNSSSGTFIELTQVYTDADTLRDEADSKGCFSFSRPEDLHDNPADASQVVFASTGRSSLYPEDSWGTVYVIHTDVEALTATLEIIHDADDLAVPDSGVRSPDNLVWATDGQIYIQEDRSIGDFGDATGIEASIWQVDPVTYAYTRIAEMDRSAVAPSDATDNDPNDLGDWESSGILDVSALFGADDDEVLLLADVQAHSVRDGSIGDNNLVQGGQLILLSR